MSYKEINIRSQSADAAVTEIMYEIAACRADAVELIRFNISYASSEGTMNEGKKIFSHAIRTLKNMKQKGSVQFIATEVDFATESTESNFLYNKYPEIFNSTPVARENEEYIYVKI